MSLRIHNGQAVAIERIPQLRENLFRERLLAEVAAGGRIAALFAAAVEKETGSEDIPASGVDRVAGAAAAEKTEVAQTAGRSRRGSSTPEAQIFAVIAHDTEGALVLLRMQVRGSYAALTPDCPQAHLFEREIHEQSGIIPAGHPWLKPVRFAPAWIPAGTMAEPTASAAHGASSGPMAGPYSGLTPGHPPLVSAEAGTAGPLTARRTAGGPAAAAAMAGVQDFYTLEGEGMHEVAVGPVHAGVIEPGHFRFQCLGETVHHLEIALGYQHRGIEEHLAGGPWPRSVYQIEAAAGDSTIGHTTAWCQNLEALTGLRPSARAQAIRGLALELERLANHIGDLGALAGDVGFLPTATYAGAIRGDFLNMSALLCGSRLGRGLVRPGGVIFDLPLELGDRIAGRLKQGQADITSAVNLLWNAPSVLSRFEETGRVELQTALEIGLVGPAARASGIERDVRHDHPAGIYALHQIPLSVLGSGDVHGRAMIRWLEIQRSLTFCQELLAHLPGGQVSGPATLPPLKAESLAVSLSEGWRGEICHVALTGRRGEIVRYKIVDPSFHNWFGLALALRGGAISDFPLCNKSFNLSYCGFDL